MAGKYNQFFESFHCFVDKFFFANLVQHIYSCYTKFANLGLHIL